MGCTIKVSIWLKGGGKLIKEFTNADPQNFKYIKTQFESYIATNPICSYLTLDNCIVKFEDISAIDIEEKYN